MTTPPKILLLGFLPFAGHSLNPAQQLVEWSDVPGECLPVVLADALPLASQAVKRYQPDAVVALGQCPGTTIRVERTAFNLAQFDIPDEAGAQPQGEPIAPNGPDTYTATLPVQEIQTKICADGVPAVISDDAGRFLCNALMYHLLHIASTQPTPLITGFIHVPLLPAQACAAIAKGLEAPPSMPLASMKQGLQIALDAIRVYLTKAKV